ncbi:putative nuclease HARBI1 [Xyrichtys novacula]|uniref:Nuclease HARBI1 n=1 Tax=Xyrichtys novacula TaxID=13765 RepID=A0AAV1EHJ9_XYRNO|nr:putative nuclease HARBI1 [Xyrichtys novacula]
MVTIRGWGLSLHFRTTHTYQPIQGAFEESHPREVQCQAFSGQECGGEGIWSTENQVAFHISQGPGGDVDFVSEVIVDCLFLHNLCLGHRDILEPEDGEEVDGDDNCLAAHDLAQQTGDAFRDRMAAAISVPEEQIPALREHDY